MSPSWFEIDATHCTTQSYYRQMAIPSSWTYDAPSHIQFDLNGNVSGEEHQVYLTEPYATQLRVDGTAIGAANLTRKWKILAEGSEKMVGIKFGVSLIENMEMAKGVSLLRCVRSDKDVQVTEPDASRFCIGIRNGECERLANDFQTWRKTCR
jgi:hypothetical protein